MEVDPKKWLDSEKEVLNAKIGGRSFIELTAYQSVALWWFVRFRLYHSAEANRLAELLVKSQYVFSCADFLYDFLTSLLCRFISAFFKSQTEATRPKVLMFASNSGWVEMHNAEGKMIKGDLMLDSIMKEMQERRYGVVTVSPLKYSISAVKIMIERLKMGDVIHKESNAYWSIKIWIKEHYAKKFFRKIWKTVLENDREFLSLQQKYPLIKDMRHYFNSLFGHVVKQIEMAKKAVSEQNPDLILVTSEYGFFERGLVVAGKLKGIPTLALQHGNIGPVHKGYIYPEDSISEWGNIETPYCPVPDKTAVYGRYYYDLLTKMSAYPPNSVVISGQPRYDILAATNGHLRREKFCGKVNLDPDRKIVLVATENLPIPKGEAFLRNVLRALKNLPDLQVVVKPHPRERGEWYNEVVKEENDGAIVLSKEADTFEALYACDLLITGFSTVVTEATILGRPSVTVHRGEVEDPTPYYRDVTLRTYRDEDLIPAIKEALYDDETREKLEEARRKFLYLHAYRQDGRATERVADLVEEMIKGRQHG